MYDTDRLTSKTVDATEDGAPEPGKSRQMMDRDASQSQVQECMRTTEA